MTHPWVMDINCVKYYLDPVRSYGPDMDFRYQCTVTLTFVGMTFVQVHEQQLCKLDMSYGTDTPKQKPLGHRQQLCEVSYPSYL